MNFDICNKYKYKTNKYFLDLISENQYKFLGVYKHDTILVHYHKPAPCQ